MFPIESFVKSSPDEREKEEKRVLESRFDFEKKKFFFHGLSSGSREKFDSARSEVSRA